MSHSPNLDKLDQEASMQNIDRLVEALEMEARESGMSKCRKLFLDEASSSALKVYQPLDREEASTSAVQVYQPPAREEASTSAIQVYQPLAREEASTSAVQVYHPLERSIVPSFPNYGITLEELLVLSRDEVFPYVNTHRLKIDGIIKILGELFQPTGSSTSTTFECIVDLSAASLRKLVDFLVKGECRRILPPFEVEAEFLKHTDRKYKKDAWQDIAPWFGFSLNHSQPRSEGWVVNDFKKYSLEGHPDGYALDKQVRLVINQVQRMVGGKFREGWEAIVRIVTIDFLAKQAITRHEPLLLEARNAFTNTKAEWDNEKGELVREREALKEELNKAKEMATKGEQRTEAVRLEKEALQQQYAKDKVEWERKNTQLIEEVGHLHEEKKRNAAREVQVMEWEGRRNPDNRMEQALVVSFNRFLGILQDLLKSLAKKRFVTLWTIGRMTLESLQSPESYKTDIAHKVLAPLFALSKIWKWDHPSSSTQGTTEVEYHDCVPPPQLPRNSSLWLAV
ncbi:hypothetical protein R1flu_005076 [Riccia fluitans]|uniref:WHIM2 domain-containing protein n=1 Tax=Riccia fluitans TaxID=41844 RepID=A0ABD1YV54_9MARC